MSAHLDHLSTCCLALALLAAPAGCGSTEETSSGPVVPSGGPADPTVGDCPAKAPVLACGQPALAGIAVDHENVYYGVDGAIMKVPIQGGVPVMLVRLTVSATAIAVHGKDVFWIDDDHVVTVDGGSVHKIAITGGAPVLLATTEDPPAAIAVDDESVYWVDRSAVRKVPAAGGGAPTMVAPASQAMALAVDGTSVYWTELLGADSNPDANDGRVMRAPIKGGSAVVLASDQAHPIGIAVDAVSVYWTTLGSTKGLFAPLGNGGVYKIAIGGSAPITPLVDGDTISSFSTPAQIALDAEYVYWVDSSDGKVSKIPIAGGTPEIVSDGQGSSRDIAVDEKQIYLLDDIAGTVTRIAP